jgi:hypothetical protein
MKYSCDTSALLIFLLIVIIFMNKTGFHLVYVDRQDKANSRFLVTAVSVDISQNTVIFMHHDLS